MLGLIVAVCGFACWPIGYSMCNEPNHNDARDDYVIFGTIVQAVGALLFLTGLAINGWIE